MVLCAEFKVTSLQCSCKITNIFKRKLVSCAALCLDQSAGYVWGMKYCVWGLWSVTGGNFFILATTRRK